MHSYSLSPSLSYLSISPALLSLAPLLLYILGLAVFDLHYCSIWSSFSWGQRKVCLFFYVCAWFLDTQYDDTGNIILHSSHTIDCTLTKFCTQVAHHAGVDTLWKKFQMCRTFHTSYLRTKQILKYSMCTYYRYVNGYHNYDKLLHVDSFSKVVYWPNFACS